MHYILSLVLFFSFFGCVSTMQREENPFCSEYQFFTLDELRDSFVVEEKKEISTTGVIVKYENLLLINKPNIGVHIIDNSDTTHPINKKFLQILGNLDIAVKDGVLYADSYSDLLLIDIRDIDNIKVLKREKDIFHLDVTQALSSSENDTSPSFCFLPEVTEVVVSKDQL